MRLSVSILSIKITIGQQLWENPLGTGRDGLMNGFGGLGQREGNNVSSGGAGGSRVELFGRGNGAFM